MAGLLQDMDKGKPVDRQRTGELAVKVLGRSTQLTSLATALLVAGDAELVPALRRLVDVLKAEARLPAWNGVEEQEEERYG